jgi:hypothetical protein
MGEVELNKALSGDELEKINSSLNVSKKVAAKRPVLAEGRLFS